MNKPKIIRMQRTRRQIAKIKPYYEVSSKAYLIMISISLMKYSDNPPELKDFIIFSSSVVEWVDLDEYNCSYESCRPRITF
jgi:hypothetical protein